MAETSNPQITTAKYRSIFISDVHLGSKSCKSQMLISFLKNNTSENLYLVGDIIDGWRLKRRAYWPQEHTNVIRRFLTAAKRDTNVFYIAGNHDEFIRPYLAFNPSLGNIKISNREEYTSINGDKFLVLHGDLFDNLMRSKSGKWLMHFGDWGYDWLVLLNDSLNFFRSKLGFDYWSLNKYLKHKTKKVLEHINGFEIQLADYAKSKGYDGIICGHIHTPCIKYINGVHYFNSGDWVENCSAVVEHWNGSWEIIYENSNSD